MPSQKPSLSIQNETSLHFDPIFEPEFAQMEQENEASRNLVLKLHPELQAELQDFINNAVQRQSHSISQKADFNRVIMNNNTIVNVKPIQSNKFSMTFEYAIVQIERYWLDTKIFQYSDLWYSLAKRQSYFSNGKRSALNNGPLSAIPMAFIVIKNLKINADWTNHDVEQAKICNVLPKMPLTNDKNLVVD
ncbi:hypothetical protein [Methylobacter sp.]|uniref:hypothetical protein n=1 Tax=Methylobacter sp. TaxID=2051955 RepID=UPI002FDEFC44